LFLFRIFISGLFPARANPDCSTLRQVGFYAQIVQKFGSKIQPDKLYLAVSFFCPSSSYESYPVSSASFTKLLGKSLGQNAAFYILTLDNSFTPHKLVYRFQISTPA